MKALVLACLLLGLGTTAQAQMKDRYAERSGTSTPTKDRVEDLTRSMSQQLHLNEAQFIQLRAVNTIKLARVEEIEWQYHETPLERDARLSELQSQYEQECSRILTPSQLSMLLDEQHRDVVPATNPTDGGLG